MLELIFGVAAGAGAGGGLVGYWFLGGGRWKRMSRKEISVRLTRFRQMASPSELAGADPRLTELTGQVAAHDQRINWLNLQVERLVMQSMKASEMQDLLRRTVSEASSVRRPEVVHG